jgi:hypothetical protein
MILTPSRVSILAATVSNALGLIKQTITDPVSVTVASHRRFRSPMQHRGNEGATPEMPSKMQA